MQLRHQTDGTPMPTSPVVVHVVEHMMPGGIETLVLDMTAGLTGRHTIFSLSGQASALRAAWPRLGCDPTPLEAFGREGGVSVALIQRIAARLKSIGPDAVVLHHIGPLLYGGLAARLARVPTIIHVEHDAWHYKAGNSRMLGRALFALVRPTRIAVSDEVAETTVRLLSGKRAQVIPPGIDMERYKPADAAAARARLGLPAGVAVIGTSGRLVPVKNQAALIDALALLRSNSIGGLGSHLVIVGDGPERQALAARAQAAGLTDAVHLVGHRDDLPALLPAFDVFCLPSLNEGLPRAVLEAQAAGLPVVATAVGALASALCPETGRLVPVADVPALAHAIAAALTSPADPDIPRSFVKSRFSLTQSLSAFRHVIMSGHIPCSS